ncbi:hypothetical protein KUTeg_015124 [Tegillarca granosa]|uniref:BZIP domain-containing protein n=1 Tax=Tegillarca granosa TaxID=220873 RepID=A0ABQ9EPE7_TEGGR|nr:hypothetical protein KUTeg_015124 [Tegillarca granosa]
MKRLIATIKHKRLETQRQKSTEKCTKDLNKSSTLKMERLASNPEPWTNWSTFWTSEQNLDFSMLTSPTTSKISLRLDQNQSGLFDNELAGFNHKDDAGKPDLDLDYNINNKDDFALSFDELSNGEVDVENMINRLAEGLPGEEYLESFMDLSFLLQDNVPLKSEDIAEPQQEIAPVEEPPKSESVKRKLDDVVTMEMEDDPAAVSIDHDYVCKKPRLTEVVVESVTEAEPSTSTASKMMRSPAQKYRERREKNNIASKRSRETRKMKFKDMELEAVRLVEENQNLKVKIVELEKMAKE